MSEIVMNKKKEPSLAMLVVVLTAISLITALLLGAVNMVTAPQIKLNTEKKTAEALQAVLPTEDGVYTPVEYTGEDSTVQAV